MQTNTVQAKIKVLLLELCFKMCQVAKTFRKTQIYILHESFVSDQIFIHPVPNGSKSLFNTTSRKTECISLVNNLMFYTAESSFFLKKKKELNMFILC